MRFCLTFIILYSFWILLSGHFDFLHLFLGILCSLAVAFFSLDFLIGESDIKAVFTKAGRFLRYLPWLFYEIAIANLDLAYRTLHPKMPIDPQIIKFRTDLETDIGMVILANSITLTPGTVTVDIVEGEYIVHAISSKSAERLLQGKFQARVKQIEGRSDV